MEHGLHVDMSQLDKLSRKVNNDLASLKEEIIKRLCAVGEKAVKIARENGNYEDRTGNLRSSIGYMVLIDGESVFEGGQKAVSGTNADGVAYNGTSGVTESQNMLNKIKSELPAKGAVLVVCAGMQYAWYVEHLYGKDVTASAELEATNQARKLLKID